MIFVLLHDLYSCSNPCCVLHNTQPQPPRMRGLCYWGDEYVAWIVSRCPLGDLQPALGLGQFLQRLINPWSRRQCGLLDNVGGYT